MPDTLANIDLPANEWVDLYDITGIAVGSRIAVENIGVVDVQLVVQAAEPPVGHERYNVVKRGGLLYANTAGDSGAWAYAPNAPGKVNVKVVQ